MLEFRENILLLMQQIYKTVVLPYQMNIDEYQVILKSLWTYVKISVLTKILLS